ncbi:MAG: hypothetical protein ACKO5E_18510, partial [bacterium]
PPTAIEIPVLKLPDQMQMLGKSVIGELTIRIMLNRFGGRNAAIGWDGDTLAVFQSKSEAKRFAGIWVSTWDSAKDAAEFAKAVAAAFGKSGMNVKITEADTDVIVAIGWDDKAANELTSQLSGRYKKTEKKFNWDKKPQKTSVR